MKKQLSSARITQKKAGWLFNINVDREQIWANSSMGHKILNIYAPKEALQNTWNKSDRNAGKIQISSILVKDFSTSLFINNWTSGQQSRMWKIWTIPPANLT